ncbi:MAG TPA: WYL domain-containing protein [Candidatus Aphodousia faecipullorum]|nr:WYL domain-containing protein [Candidatus Aphodousia faecipullorum]
MDFNVRLMKIDRLIAEKGVATLSELMQATGASIATTKRDIAYMREQLKAPIVFSRMRGGYVFAKTRAEAKRGDFYDRRSMWFTPEELHCTVRTLEDFKSLEANRKGYLSKDLAQMSARIRSSIFSDEANCDELLKRVVLFEPQSKPINCPSFEVLGQALVHRNRLRIVYHSDEKNEETERIISPMRLCYYKGSWYLDAWCHKRDALRTFNVENIVHAELLQTSVKPVPMKVLRSQLDAFYGFYRADDISYARIRFVGQAAKRASKRIWHPDQFEQWINQIYELTIPCSPESPELVSEILSYGPQAKVIEPVELRNAILKALTRTLKNYE